MSALEIEQVERVEIESTSDFTVSDISDLPGVGFAQNPRADRPEPRLFYSKTPYSWIKASDPFILLYNAIRRELIDCLLIKEYILETLTKVTPDIISTFREWFVDFDAFISFTLDTEKTLLLPYAVKKLNNDPAVVEMVNKFKKGNEKLTGYLHEVFEVSEQLDPSYFKTLFPDFESMLHQFAYRYSVHFRVIEDSLVKPLSKLPVEKQLDEENIETRMIDAALDSRLQGTAIPLLIRWFKDPEYKFRWVKSYIPEETQVDFDTYEDRYLATHYRNYRFFLKKERRETDFISLYEEEHVEEVPLKEARFAIGSRRPSSASVGPASTNTPRSSKASREPTLNRSKSMSRNKSTEDFDETQRADSKLARGSSSKRPSGVKSFLRSNSKAKKEAIINREKSMSRSQRKQRNLINDDFDVVHVVEEHVQKPESQFIDLDIQSVKSEEVFNPDPNTMSKYKYSAKSKNVMDKTTVGDMDNTLSALRKEMAENRTSKKKSTI